MVFGANKNSGLKNIKAAVGNEGAISERMRLSHITELKDKEEQRRAKTSLEDKRRIFELNKRDISNLETEVRRLNGELTRAQAALISIEAEMKEEQEKVSVLVIKYNDMLFQINNEKDIIRADRTRIEKDTQELHHYESEIKAIEFSMTKEKEDMRQINQHIDTFVVKIAHLTNDANKAHAEVSRANSQKQYKEREKEARKRSLAIVVEKKEYEIHELQRLHAENTRLDQEIKTLESQVR